LNRPTNRFLLILLPLMLVGTLYGLFQLMALRLEQGDVYPAYSSLRTDPLGTKAFYEGLGEMKGIAVSRNYTPADRIESVRETTYFDLGDNSGEVFDVPVAAAPDVENYVVQGGRLVVTLVGENTLALKHHRRGTFEKTPTPAATPGATPSSSPLPTRPPLTPTATEVPASTFGKQWGVQTGIEPLPQSTEKGRSDVLTTYLPVTVVRNGVGKLPKALPWHSALYFKDLDPAWKVLYRRGDNPVAIERTLGKGALVLLGDSYLVSNEAMQKDRFADLLAYLAGERPRVIFDETHLGVFESENTATLARKYGLAGFVLGLALLALLFIWRSSMSLVPPPEEEGGERTGPQSGKDFSTGLVNLLRRNIPARDILSVCFAQWKKTFAQERKHLAPKAVEMEREVERQRKDPKTHPVEGYLKVSRILKKRKF
jgi:hypothetical protein